MEYDNDWSVKLVRIKSAALSKKSREEFAMQLLLELIILARAGKPYKMALRKLNAALELAPKTRRMIVHIG